MADNRQQQEQNALLAEAKQLMRDINRLRVQMNQEPLDLSDQDAVRGIQSLRNEFKSLAKDIADVDGTASNLFDQLQGIAKEFGAIESPAKQLKSAFSGMVAEASKLKNDELGLIDLRTKDLEKLQEKMKVLNESARVAATQFGDQRTAYEAEQALLLKKTELNQEILDLAQEIQQAELEGVKTEQEILALKDSQAAKERELVSVTADHASKAAEVSDEARAAFQYLEDQDSAYNGIQNKITQRLKTESEISRLTGVTGALVEGTGALMERLGMRSGIFHDAMRESAEEMRQMAKDTAAGVKNFTKLEIAAKGFSIVAKGFGKALFDPASAALALVTGFLDVQKAAAKAAQLTGQFDMSMGAANSTLATTTDVLETAVELTQKLGMNAQNVISDVTLAKAAELKNTMGLAADEAAGLAVMAQTSGRSLDGVTEAVVNTTSEFNKANRSAVSQGVILRDVAKTSDSIKASLGNNPKALAEAASAARRMGMELSRVDQIADSLMNFESSIEAELEAQLLTGKNINMAKARELALNNDLAGLSKELFKNSSSIAEFGKMNRIQQEAQAKALGMSKDELAKIAYQRSLELGMTEEQAAAAAGVNAEDMKRMDIQEKIQKLVGKLQQAFAPILEVVVDIVDALAPAVQVIGGIIGGVVKFLNKLGIIKPVLLSIAAIFALKSFAQPFGAAVTGAQKLAENLKGSFGSGSSIMKGVKKFGNSIQSSFLAGRNGVSELTKDSKIYFDENVKRFRSGETGRFVSKDLAEKAGVKIPGADKTKDILPDTDSITDTVKTPEPTKGLGEKIKEFLTGLTDGLKYAGENAGKVALGGLALIPAALGLVAMTPALPAMALMQLINGKKFSAALTGIGEGVAGLGKLLMGPQGLALLAGAGMIALLGASLIPLGIAVSYFSADSGVGLLTAGIGLAGLSVGIIGMAAALPFLIPASISLLAFGYVLKKIGPWLAEAAPGFAALADIGKGLVQAGMGLMALGAGIALLGAGAALLAVFGPVAAIGLTALAAGVLAAGILVIPAIPGLLALAGVMALLAPSLKMLGEVGPGLAAAGAGMLALGPALMALGVSALFAPMALIAGLAIAQMLKVLYPAIQPFFGMGKEMLSIGKGMQGLGAGIALMGAGAALIGVFGPLFAFGLTAMGAGIAAFGVQLANPLFYAGIAALAIMSAGLAAAAGILNLAAPAFQGLGDAGAGMLKFAGALAALGPAMMLFGATALFGLPALYMAIPAFAALALMGTGLERTANSLSTIAMSIKQISDAVSNLELAKIEELQDLISTTAMAAPALAAAGVISQTVSAIGAGNEKESSTDAKLDELIAAVKSGQIVKVYTDPGAIKEWMEINTSQSE